MTSPPIGGVVMVMGLPMPVVAGADGLPACGCVLVGVDGGCAVSVEAGVAEAPAVAMDEVIEGAESLEQLASSDPRIGMAA
ncbi:MAG TPA: hypothetical protein VJV78_25680 [Polyangiales bacterium]|nr:hypothetical protein [Polyangiales bacterium]